MFQMRVIVSFFDGSYFSALSGYSVELVNLNVIYLPLEILRTMFSDLRAPGHLTAVFLTREQVFL